MKPKRHLTGPGVDYDMTALDDIEVPGPEYEQRRRQPASPQDFGYDMSALQDVRVPPPPTARTANTATPQDFGYDMSALNNIRVPDPPRPQRRAASALADPREDWGTDADPYYAALRRMGTRR